jgi:RNA polymerase sigma factor (sigma-70 family)
MATQFKKVLDHLHRVLAPPGSGPSDGQLLARFLAARDEVAFTELVRRHGPMVLGVCRRLLRHTQDAEDCFQATFLVLARKAATVQRESVGSWLYAVAFRTSLEARANIARRRARERQVEDMPHPQVMPVEAQDWRPWLDQELNRLPENYRAAIVACDLEGLPRKEAARLLGVAEGTVSSRLARGRRLLANRLAKYGLSLSVGALALTLSQGASSTVPVSLMGTTVKTALLLAAGQLAADMPAAVLMKGVLKTMFLAKLKLAIGAVMIVTVLGASGLVYRAAGQSTVTEKRSDDKPRTALEKLRRENELLKLNLEVVLEKVRAQEAELRTLKTQERQVRSLAFSPDGKILASIGPAQTIKFGIFDAATGKELDEKAALKALGTAQEKKDMLRAVDELEKALKKLRQQLKKPEGDAPSRKK